MADKTFSKEDLMEKYSDHLLSEGERPKNVYAFAEALGISEPDFYQNFSGFEALEKEYLVYFFGQSLELAEKSENYPSLSAKEKLLNFYYIFFENLTINRSLILMLFDGDHKTNLQYLKPLRPKFIDYIKSLNLSDFDIFENAPEKVKTCKTKSRKEILWLHFLSILKFWKEDDSPGFEKTDIYIEKSINTGFELTDNPLIDKMFDLGKFLWQENFQFSK